MPHRPASFRLRPAATAAALIAALGLAACGGGDSENQQRTDVRTTTLGQELKDLKEAFDNGAISESEYRQARARILEGG